MIGFNLRKIALMVAAVLVAAAFFAGYVWKENQFIQLVQKGRILEGQEARLTNEIVLIELDNKKLMDFNRLERIGVDRFAFVYEGVPKLVYPDGSAPARGGKGE